MILRSLGEAGHYQSDLIKYPLPQIHDICNNALKYWCIMYAYLLQSKNHPQQRYIGSTKNIRQRIREHNQGKSIHTSKFKPWRIVTCIWLSNQKKAAAFEKYLKHGSGHAFANKHFW